MMSETQGAWRYFVTYSGVRLPLKLAEELTEAGIHNRNTYFRAQFDGQGRVTAIDKMVYGDVALSHRYGYHGTGALAQAVIAMSEEERVLTFDEAGQPV